jgi:hypothetical protein
VTRAVALLTFVALLVAGQARADDAIELGQKGLELYNARRWVEAYDRFALAERAEHSPVFQLYLGRCKMQLGELLAAREHLTHVALERLPEDPPEVWQRAQAEAKSELEALSVRIPTVRVRVLGDLGSSHLDDTWVTVDGDTHMNPERPFELDPGDHVIGGRRGQGTGSEKITLAEGEQRVVTIRLRWPKAKEPVHEEAEAGPDLALGGAIVLGIAGAGLVVGAITGGMALSITDDIEERCIDTSCLASDADEGDRAATLATVSTVSFVAAGVLAVAGITLLVVPYATADDTSFALGVRARF